MKAFILILVISWLHAIGYSQNNISYQIELGPSLTVPKISYGSLLFGNVKFNGNSYLGYDLKLGIRKDLNNFGIGITTGYLYSRYGYDSNELIFPEDAANGTASTLNADNRVQAIPFGLLLRYYLSQSGFYVETGPVAEVEISNKSHQEIHFGFDPGVIEISDNKDQIYESGTKIGLNVFFGLKPEFSDFGFAIGLNYGLTQHKYYTTGWNIRPVRLQGLISYNF